MMTTTTAPRTFPKTFKVKSFGCQMNVYDGERMGELLSAQGKIGRASCRERVCYAV